MLVYITTVTVDDRNKDRWLSFVNELMNLRVPTVLSKIKDIGIIYFFTAAIKAHFY
jgi:hypothetical protein